MENKNVKNWIESIEEMVNELKQQKKSLRNEINELKLSLKILEFQIIKENELNQLETIEEDSFKFHKFNIESGNKAIDRAILYLKQDFLDIKQQIVGMNCDLEIIEHKSVK